MKSLCLDFCNSHNGDLQNHPQNIPQYCQPLLLYSSSRESKLKAFLGAKTYGIAKEMTAVESYLFYGAYFLSKFNFSLVLQVWHSAFKLDVRFIHFDIRFIRFGIRFIGFGIRFSREDIRFT